MERTEYEELEIEVITFESEDMIVCSPDPTGEFEGDIV